jgi:hut operon positive regulator
MMAYNCLEVERNSLALKIGIAARDEWLAVAISGRSALHVVTNHWRAGLGVMHLHHR